MEKVLEADRVTIGYKTGDFRDIGLKEWTMRHLTHNYHVEVFRAVRDVSFDLCKGEMLGVIGSNGAGKSTLLKAVSGIMEPTEGRIERRGSISALLELASGFDGELTVKENAYLRGAMLGYTRAFMDGMYERIIDFAELRDFEDKPFKQLSTGMQSRLAFSIASLVQPDILILDEVLSVGDGAFQEKSARKMREIIGGGAATIYVSHSIENVRALCSKVLWLHRGEQLAFGTDVRGVCDAYEEFLKTGALPEAEIAVADRMPKESPPLVDMCAKEKDQKKIIVVSVMKNEEVFAESSVRYWLTFADTVMVCDDNSTDGTGDILNALCDEWKGRVVLFHPDFKLDVQQIQMEATNAMIDEAFTSLAADVVLPLDTDEYPYVPDCSRGTVRDVLRGLDQGRCFSAQWIQFSPPENGAIDDTRLAPLSFRKKRKTPITQSSMVILTGGAYRADPVHVTPGNHELFRPSGNGAPPVESLTPDLYYAHFMYRGLSHYKSKVANGWLAWYTKSDWKPGYAEHYRLACQKLLEGKLTQGTVEWASFTISGLTGEGMDDVRDCAEIVDPKDYFPNIPLLYTKKFSKKRDDFSLLLETSLAIAEQYKELQKRFDPCENMRE